MEKLKEKVELMVTNDQISEVVKVTPSKVKEAASKLSDSKNDPIYSFSSDCLKNGTELLFDLLALVFQSFLSHGHFSLYLLLATFIPILKD